MGFLASLHDEQRAHTIAPLTLQSPELAKYFGGGPTSTGIAVNEETALNYSAVWAAVSMIASDVASLPFILYQRLPDGGKTRYIGSKLYKLLKSQPNPEMGAMVFRETLTAHVLLTGNGYAEIVRDGADRPRALWPITPDRVTPYRTSTRAPLQYRVASDSGRPIDLDAHHMLHIPGLGFDGNCGYSVVNRARESMGLGLATERFGGTFFGNGASFGGVFMHPGKFTEQAQKNFRDSLAARHQGVDRAHKFLVVEENMTYARLGIPPNEAQFLETRKFQIEEIARWFRIPQHKIGAMDRATFSNISDQNLDYYQSCLRSWLVRWEEEVDRKLIPESEQNIQFTEHLADAILRGDTTSRFNAYALAHQHGWMSADDIREKENMNPLPNGQGKLYVWPQNSWPADHIDDMMQAQKGKASTPPTGTDATADDTAARALALLETRLVAADVDVSTARTTIEAKEQAIAALQQTAGVSDIDRARLTADLDAARSTTATLELMRLQIEGERDTVKGQLAEEATARRLAEVAAAEATLKAERAIEQANALVTRTQTDLDAAQTREREAKAEAERRAGDAEAAAQLAAEAMSNRDLEAAARQEADRLVTEAQAQAATALRTADDAIQSAQDARIAAEQAETARTQALAALEASQATVATLETTRTTGAEALRVALEQQGNLDAGLTVRTAELGEWQSRHQAEADARATAETERDAKAAEVDAVKIAEAARVAVIQAERDAAVTDADAREAARLAEVTARHQAEAERDAHLATASAVKQADLDRRIRTVGVHRGLIVDVWGRMIRRETGKARGAQATPAKLRAWVQSFYATHEETARIALLPAIRAVQAWDGAAEDPVVVTADLVQAEARESQRQLTVLLDAYPDDLSQPLETLLRQWERDRPDALADRYLQTAITALRSAMAESPLTERSTAAPVLPIAAVTPPHAAALPPIQIDIHQHSAKGSSKTVRFRRNLDGGMESATIDDEDDGA